jgi:hypothetical protein
LAEQKLSTTAPVALDCTGRRQKIALREIRLSLSIPFSK